MGNNDSSPFEILQSAGGGTKCLVIPLQSTSFFWTRIYIYILAKDDLCFIKKEEQVLYLFTLEVNAFSKPSWADDWNAH